mgnify:CR=1 FL=1
MIPYDPSGEEKDDLTFVERHKVALSVVAAGVISGGVYGLHGKFSHPSSSPQNKPPQVVSVRLPPPPPTPPPPAAPTPPPPQEVKEEKMVEQEKVEENEEKPDDKPPEAAPVTTGIAGGGPDAFGLKGGGGASFGSGAKRRSQYGWYAAQIQGAVAEALRKTPGARTARFSVKVRVWSDAAGRITRSKLANSGGDAKLDEAIRQALDGLQLKEPPPAGMPMPIVMRISGQRPN